MDQKERETPNLSYREELQRHYDQKNNEVNSVKELTEEEQFLEEVLRAQEEALQKEREERLIGQKPKKRLPFLARIMVWFISFTLIFSLFGFIFEMYSIPAIEFIKTSTRLSADEKIQGYKEAVVEVSTGNSKGTGFAITDDGYIVTNSHVIDDALQLTVVFPEDGIMEAEIIADYPEVDLAVIKVAADNLTHLKIADEYEKKQQHVTFIGNPLAFTGIANEGTMLEEITLELDTPVLILDAPVYKGNSGSPVISKNGEVIGVIYATYKHKEFGKVGLFIPIEALLERFPLTK